MHFFSFCLIVQFSIVIRTKYSEYIAKNEIKVKKINFHSIYSILNLVYAIKIKGNFNCKPMPPSTIKHIQRRKKI